MFSEILRPPLTEDRSEPERMALTVFRRRKARAAREGIASVSATGWRFLHRCVSVALALATLACSSAGAAESGDVAVVIYNSNSPDSKAVALHYANKRGV